MNHIKQLLSIALAVALIIGNGGNHRGSGRGKEDGDKKALTPPVILVDLEATKLVN